MPRRNRRKFDSRRRRLFLEPLEERAMLYHYGTTGYIELSTAGSDFEGTTDARFEFSRFDANDDYSDIVTIFYDIVSGSDQATPGDDYDDTLFSPTAHTAMPTTPRATAFAAPKSPPANTRSTSTTTAIA